MVETEIQQKKNILLYDFICYVYSFIMIYIAIFKLMFERYLF